MLQVWRQKSNGNKYTQKEKTRPLLLMFMEPSLSVRETHLSQEASSWSTLAVGLAAVKGIVLEILNTLRFWKARVRVFCSWKSDVRLFAHLHSARLLFTDCNASPPSGDSRTVSSVPFLASGYNFLFCFVLFWHLSFSRWTNCCQWTYNIVIRAQGGGQPCNWSWSPTSLNVSFCVLVSCVWPIVSSS